MQWQEESRRHRCAALLSNMAAVHNHSRRWPLALDCCQAALDLRPDYGKALLQRAKIHLHNNHKGKAAKDLMHLSSLSTSSEQLVQQAGKLLDGIRETTGAR